MTAEYANPKPSLLQRPVVPPRFDLTHLYNRLSDRQRSFPEPPK